MLPGPTLIRECPGCQCHIEEFTLASGNTFGGRFWTDGKMVAPMLPDIPWLVKCPKCKLLFWLDEATLEDTKELESFFGEDDSYSFEKPDEEELLAFLEKEKLSKEKEHYIRTRAWWLANDSYRWEKGDEQGTFNKKQQENMLALFELLDEKESDQKLMKAELARERGKFDEALDLLHSSFPHEVAKVVSLLKQLCEEKITNVTEIKYDEL